MITADDAESASNRRLVKSEAAFRTISEVSEDLAVPQHVLRFWESKFPQIKPLKRGGGRRYYRPEDLQLLKRIRDFLYRDGYTIRGVQKLLREQARHGGSHAEEAHAEIPAHDDEVATEVAEPESERSPAESDPAAEPSLRAEIEALLDELEDMRRLLAEARNHPP